MLEWVGHCNTLQHAVAHCNNVHVHGCIMIVSAVWMSHVSQMHESCRTYECVMSSTWIAAWMNPCECPRSIDTSCLPYEWVTRPIGMSHATHMNVSWLPHALPHECVQGRCPYECLLSPMFHTNMQDTTWSQEATRGEEHLVSFAR